MSTANLVNGVPSPSTGFDFASFLLGTPDTSALRYGNSNLYFRTHAYDIYATDDWRISPKFSINFGLRWDYASPITELYNKLVNLDVAPGYAAIAQVLPGQAGPYSGALPASLIRPDRNNISPRIGFAWRPIPKKSIVIRGGYGTYYNSSVYNTIANNMAQQPPFAQTLSVASSPANPLTIQNGFLIPSRTPITNTYGIDPNYRIGYAQMWQIAIQNDLGHSLVGTLTYNGTKGTHLDQTILPNSAPSGAKANGLPAGLSLRAIEREFDLPGHLRAVAAALPQRHFGQCGLHVLQGDRQRGAGAELPGHFGGARALQQQPHSRAQRQLAVQHRGGPHRRHHGQRLEGRADQGLDLHQQHQRFERIRR